MCRCDSTCGHSCLCSCHPWDRTATGSPTPTTAEALAAVGVARARFNAAVAADPDVPDPAARVLDALGREWARQTNGGWGAIGSTATADSFAEIEAKYGPCEVIA